MKNRMKKSSSTILTGLETPSVDCLHCSHHLSPPSDGLLADVVRPAFLCITQRDVLRRWLGKLKRLTDSQSDSVLKVIVTEIEQELNGMNEMYQEVFQFCGEIVDREIAGQQKTSLN
jgi:hypothetical protein